MAIIGSNWRDDKTPQEEYRDITGKEFHGTKEELRKQIESDRENLWTSKIERIDLLNLLIKIDNNTEG